MARACEICGKKTTSGGTLSRRGLPKKKGGVGLRITGHSLRKYHPNLQRVRASGEGGSRRVRVCTRCIKSGRLKKPLAAQVAS
jgi:large subunit ribosomal protein L28